MEGHNLLAVLLDSHLEEDSHLVEDSHLEGQHRTLAGAGTLQGNIEAIQIKFKKDNLLKQKKHTQKQTSKQKQTTDTKETPQKNDPVLTSENLH